MNPNSIKSYSALSILVIGCLVILGSFAFGLYEPRKNAMLAVICSLLGLLLVQIGNFIVQIIPDEDKQA